MTATLCFIDTETTSLRPDRRAWEIGLIVRQAGYSDDEHHWFINAEDLDLGGADPMSLKVGGYHDRHPQARGERFPLDTGEVTAELTALWEIEQLTRGAHLVGAVVSFDADVLGQRMRANYICPSWHYHVADVEALAAGWLNAFAVQLERGEPGDLPGPERAAELRAIAAPPWDSHELSRAVGIEPDDFDRHTALGDAKWARAIWDAVTG